MWVYGSKGWVLNKNDKIKMEITEYQSEYEYVTRLGRIRNEYM